MNTIINKVQLIGNIGNDTELKTFETGKKMVRISLATNETYKNASGEKVKDTQWHNLVAWGKTAELADKILKKGVEATVEGKLVNRSYTDKNNTKKYITEVVINEIKLVGSEIKAYEKS